MVALIMNPGMPGEQQFRLTPGTVTIGRTKDNAVFCLHKSLSRRHAQVEFDGIRIKITDLQSKNGIFVRGRRVQQCELLQGDTFRCGDITFLIEAATTRSPGLTRPLRVPGDGTPRTQDRAVKTLPSPIVVDPALGRRPSGHPEAQVAVGDDQQRYKDKLFLLIRASELCVSELPIDQVLDELVALVSQVLDVDRVALLTLDNETLEMRPIAIKNFVPYGGTPYSVRVVNWVVDHGSPASFADVSNDRSLPGNAAADASVRGAMCVPINPGGGTIGVIYVDSLAKTDGFRPDDLALLRAVANLAALMIESAALRNGEMSGR